MKNNYGMLVAALAAIGVLIGAGAGCVADQNGAATSTKRTGNATSTQSTTSTRQVPRPSSSTSTSTAMTAKSAEFRTDLNSLLVEHLDLAAAAMRSGFSGQPDFQAASRAVDDNSVRLGRMIGEIYGVQTEQRFLTLWRSHVTALVDYTLAVKNGNSQARDRALQNTDAFVAGMSDLLAQINPNIQKSDAERMLRRHVDLTKTMADAHFAGNYSNSYAQQRVADEQAGEMADALTQAIVRQFPDKF